MLSGLWYVDRLCNCLHADGEVGWVSHVRLYVEVDQQDRMAKLAVCYQVTTGTVYLGNYGSLEF